MVIGKPCQACGEPLVNLASLRKSVCVGCKREVEWELDRGQKPLVNINHGERPFEYAPGDRIAQIVLLPCYHGVCEEVESLDETMRAVGGFGSTGR